MIIQNILSIFILSLCLATLFITLVTYFLYRFKQLLKLGKVDASHIVEGVFFKKYAPYIQLKEKKENNEFDNKLSDRKTLMNFFALIAIIIFTSLIASYLYSYFRLGEKTIDTKKYEGLLAKGLMKEFPLNSLQADPNFVEYISEEKKRILRSSFSRLTKYKFAIYKPDRFKEFEKNQEIIFAGWKIFFDKYKLNYITFSDFSEIDFGKINILILPNAISLSKKIKGEIEKVINKKIPVFATGVTAYYDGLGDINQDQFSEKVFGIKFEKSKQKRAYYPTLFKANSIPWFDVPPGLLLNYFPSENQFYAHLIGGFPSLFEGNTQSEITSTKDDSESIVRGVFKENQTRTVWLALDPPVKDQKITEAEQYYFDLTYLNSFLWALNLPQVLKPVWKDLAKAAFVPLK